MLKAVAIIARCWQIRDNRDFMAMQLTEDQEKAIQAGQAIEVILAGTACVILSQNSYRQLLETEPSPRETYAMVLKAIDQDDEYPEQYLEYLKDA